MPIIEEITVTMSPVMIKIEANHPTCCLMLYIMVCPVTIVILLIAISKIKVKKQDKKSAQVKDIPYLAPATTIEVTLPVPTTYPTINSPGRMDNRKFLILLKFIIRKNDELQDIKK
jgi:hypothetical protein